MKAKGAAFAFAFAEATDPEGLLILEARPDNDHPDGRWFFSVAGMTSPRVEVRLGDALLWTGLPYWNNPRSRDDPYVEVDEGVYEARGESLSTGRPDPVRR